MVAERGVVVANTSFRLAPWADVLFAMDDVWWSQYGAEVRRTFRGQLLTTNSISAHRWRISYVKPDGEALISRSAHKLATGQKGTDGGQNSGYCVIQEAIRRGARQIVLLGFDCGRTDGRSHWHGDHPGKLGNGMSKDARGKVFEKYGIWRDRLRDLAPLAAARGIEIINASRATAVDCFPRMSLRDALDRLHDGVREDRSAA